MSPGLCSAVLEELSARSKSTLYTQQIQSRVHPAAHLTRTGRHRSVQQVDEEWLIRQRCKRRVAVEGPHRATPKLRGAHERVGHAGAAQSGQGTEPARQAGGFGDAV